MLGLSRRRRLSLAGETLVNPLPTVSAFSRVYVVARSCFIPRVSKKKSVDEGPYPIQEPARYYFTDRLRRTCTIASYDNNFSFPSSVKRVTLDLLHQTSMRKYELLEFKVSLKKNLIFHEHL